MLALSAVAAGCAEELTNPEENLAYEAELSFVLSVPASPEVKTTLGVKDGSTYPVYWNEGDIVTLNGTSQYFCSCR